MKRTASGNRGVYVHVPFCNTKCRYCSFFSVTDLGVTEKYLDALAREVAYKTERETDFFSGSPSATLYVGGGNPAALSEGETIRLFELLRSMPLEFGETTVEANPDSIDRNRVRLYRELGVTRLSIGVQSFDDRVLAFLGRNHRADLAKRAVEAASALFDTWSIDLIGGVPGAARDRDAEFRELERLDPPHLSYYLLSVEEHSAFWGKVATDDDQQQAEYDEFCAFMAVREYDHYEISSFARPEFRCRHNLAYWDRQPYLGFGPSSVSFVASSAGEMRMKNATSLQAYLKLPVLGEVESLDPDDVFLERLFLPLRTDGGLSLEPLRRDYPGRVAGVARRLAGLEKAGFVARRGNRWIIPEKHFTIMNEIVIEIAKEIDYA